MLRNFVTIGADLLKLGFDCLVSLVEGSIVHEERVYEGSLYAMLPFFIGVIDFLYGEELRLIVFFLNGVGLCFLPPNFQLRQFQSLFFILIFIYQIVHIGRFVGRSFIRIQSSFQLTFWLSLRDEVRRTNIVLVTPFLGGILLSFLMQPLFSFLGFRILLKIEQLFFFCFALSLTFSPSRFFRHENKNSIMTMKY